MDAEIIYHFCFFHNKGVKSEKRAESAGICSLKICSLKMDSKTICESHGNYSGMGAKIIALLGSPRLSGNTATLLEQAIRGAVDAGCEVEKIEVTTLEFRACREIFFCREQEACAMKDDMTAIYGKFRDVDGVIVATPVMTMGIPGQLKSFMDRFQVYFMAKYMRKKPMVPEDKRKHRLGLYLGISGMNVPSVFDGAKLTMHAFFDIIDVKYWDDLLVRDMDSIQDLSTRPEILKEAYRKGNEMGRLLRKTVT
jgi:multimeric flavodoxin WrbA